MIIESFKSNKRVIANLSELLKVKYVPDLLKFVFFVLRWVASDLQAKLDILREWRKNSTVSQHYYDVKGMVRHELQEKAIKFKSRDDPSGTRNLLRLHRALEFIVMFMEFLGKLENSANCVAIAQDAYKVMLASVSLNSF